MGIARASHDSCNNATGQLGKVEQLQEKGSGADLYIGIPLISPRLPLREVETPPLKESIRMIRLLGGRDIPDDSKSDA